MNEFYAQVKMERQRQQQLKALCEQKLQTAPKGFLTIQLRPKRKTYYWSVGITQGGKRKWKQLNISDNPDLQLKLAEKKVLQERLRRVNRNLKQLEKMEQEYRSTELTDIEQGIPPAYAHLLKDLRKKQLQSHKNPSHHQCPYNPKYHKHDTDCGIMVRSKSEKIIANALTAYRIPFQYELEFIYTGSAQRRIYPDFTITLPNGTTIIWEHLGLLSYEDYCIENARKLNVYQQNGYTIGENLILTMDNNEGDLRSKRINDLIQNDLLRYFT